MNVLLTRPLAQVKTLESLVNNSGHQSLLFPTLEVQAVDAISQRDQYDAVIFISANAVEYGMKILDEISYSKIFTVGVATAKKLNSYGVAVNDFPKHKPSSEALLALDSVAKLQKKNILIFRGKGGRETLRIGLEKTDNNVEYAEVYDRIICAITPRHKKSLQEFLAIDQGIISVTSNENLDGLIALASQLEGLEQLKTYPLVVLSKRIQDYALSLGFLRVLITADISDQAIVTVLMDMDTLDN